MKRFLMIVVSLLFSSQAQSGEKYALLVAVKEYEHSEMNQPPLRYPEVDATSVRDLLKESGYEVDLLVGIQATQVNVRKKLDAFSDKGRNKGVVLVGLFGHGVEFDSTKKSYFCPYDTSLKAKRDSKGNQLFDDNGRPRMEPREEKLISIDEILVALRESKASNRILLADCCRNDPNAARGRSFGTSLGTNQLPEDTAVFFACKSQEKAFEHPDWEHGAFTKCLLDSLRSNASHGKSLMGLIAADVETAVEDLVKTKVNESQTPRLLSTGARVDLQLKSLSTRKSNPPTMKSNEQPSTPGPRTTPPPLLIAPFDRMAAQSAQEGWAKSRGMNVTAKNSMGVEIVLIPPGEFMMGSEDSVEDLLKRFPYTKKEWIEDAQRRHKVRITKPFVLGKYEVTIGQFRQFVNSTGHVTDAEKDEKGGRGYISEKQGLVQDKRFNWKNTGFEPIPKDDHPVVNVSWNDSVAFCNWLSRKEGKPEYYRIQEKDVTGTGGTGYRLPTEAEWEYACRAGTITRYYNGSDPEGLIKIGNTWDAQAKTKNRKDQNFLSGSDGYAFTSPAGRFSPNNFGLYDITGNAFEWCGDWWASEYDTSVTDDPVGASSGSVRVARGGGWNGFAVSCRSAFRSDISPDFRSYHLGFRLAAAPSD